MPIPWIRCTVVCNNAILTASPVTRIRHSFQCCRLGSLEHCLMHQECQRMLRITGDSLAFLKASFETPPPPPPPPHTHTPMNGMRAHRWDPNCTTFQENKQIALAPDPEISKLRVTSSESSQPVRVASTISGPRGLPTNFPTSSLLNSAVPAPPPPPPVGSLVASSLPSGRRHTL